MEEAIRVTPVTKYEVQTKKRGRWTIDQIFNEEQRALIHANGLLGEEDDNLDAIKVVRERTNLHGYVLTTVILEKVAEGRPDKPMQLSGSLDEAPVFETEDQIYGDSHRRIVNAILREFLDHHLWTGSEFLYTYGPQKRLEMQDNLQMQHIGLVAAAQVKAHGGKMSERQGKLATQYQDAMKKAREVENDKRVINLNSDSFNDALKKLPENHGSFERRFLISTGIAMYLAKTGGWLGRLDALTAFSHPDIDNDGWFAIDSFLADVFFGMSALEEIFGNQGSVGALLEELARIATGKFEERSYLPSSLCVLSDMVGSGNLPQTRAQLAKLIIQGLLGGQRLTREEADKNINKLHDIVALVRLPENKILGGKAMIQAIEERSRRQMEPEIQRMLGQTTNPLGRIKHLLGLERKAFGCDSRDVILEYMENLLVYPGTVAKLLEEFGGAPTEKMRKINVIYKSVEKFRTTSDRKVSCLKVVDGILLEYMGTIKLLDVLRKKSKDSADLANRFLALAKGNAITPGQSMELMRNEVMELVQNPSFAEAFTAHAANDEEKTKMLRDFRKDLETVGLWVNAKKQ